MYLVRQSGTDAKRLIWIVLVALAFGTILIDDILATRWSLSALDGGYLAIALLYFGVGSLVWLHVRTRNIAALLFAFCCSIMFAFAALIGSPISDALHGLSSASSAVASLLFALLLVVFPVNLLSYVQQYKKWRQGLFAFLALCAVLCGFSITHSLGTYVLGFILPEWWNSLGLLYYVIAGILSIAFIVVAARSATSVREQQQLRLLYIGLLTAIVPILILTVLPTVLQLPYIVDGSLTMPFLIFFPLAVGYATLRYQIMILDSYLRKVVSMIIGFVSLLVIAYLLVTVEVLLFGEHVSLLTVSLAATLSLATFLIVRFTEVLVERVFFSEMRYYRGLINNLPLQGVLTDLKQVSLALTAAARETFQAAAACLFVLDEMEQIYELFTNGQEERAQERILLNVLSSALPISTHGLPLRRLEKNHPLIQLLKSVNTPVTLDDLLHRERQNPFQQAPESHARNPLLVALRVEQNIISLLVLDDRGNKGYAGPEATAIGLLLEKFTPLVQAARLTASMVSANSSLQETNAQLQEANEHLEVANRRLTEFDVLKDQFIVNVSHELRTPLTEIYGYLDLLLESKGQIDESMQTTFLQHSIHGCEELLDLVNTILEATKVERGLRPPQMEQIAVAGLVRDILNQFEPRTLNEHEIRLDIPEHLSFLSDRQYLCQVLRNLLSNAFKYSPNYSPVVIAVDEQGMLPSRTEVVAQVRLSVWDYGPGIPKDEQGLLFGRFVRLPGDMTGKVRGTGLGLYISKQLVEAMGGRIWVESPTMEGGGSKFSFSLPLVKPIIDEPSFQDAS